MKKLISLWSLFFALFLVISCVLEPTREVVVYTSVDQVFSEPILNDFEKKTGIKVKAVYDVEASKTVGLVNRLIAEKGNPRCDVFWNNEIVRTIVLKEKDVLIPYTSLSAEDIPSQFRDKDDYWTGFAARARVLIYNTKMLKEPDVPKSIFELTHPGWKGKAALAYPLFGTTATHVAAMYASLGRQKTGERPQNLAMTRSRIPPRFLPVQPCLTPLILPARFRRPGWSSMWPISPSMLWGIRAEPVCSISMSPPYLIPVAAGSVPPVPLMVQ